MSFDIASAISTSGLVICFVDADEVPILRSYLQQNQLPHAINAISKQTKNFLRYLANADKPSYIFYN